MNRREFLTTGIGAGALAATTGCLGGLDGQDSGEMPTKTVTDTETPTPTRTRTETTTPTSTETVTPTETATETPDPPAHLYDLSGGTGPPEVSGRFERTYTQRFRRAQTEFTTSIPKALFRYYDRRERIRQYGAYVSDRFDDPYVQDLGDTFEEYRKRQGQSSRAMVDHAIAFVQGMEYTSDVTEPYNEYPKYPVETLVDRGGDCEDTCILLASILRKLGYGVVLMDIPSKQHMALGLKGDDSIPGTYVERGGTRYYYVETTGEGWRVGEAPDEYVGVETRLRSVDSHPSLTLGWGTTPADGGRVRVRLGVYNAGMAAARDVRVKVRVRARGRDRPVSGADTDPLAVAPDQTAETTVEVDAPPDQTLKLRFGVTIGGEIHDLTESEWQRPG